MDPVDFIQSHIRKMQGYVPGAQRNQPNLIKLNSNENPYPAAPAVLTALSQVIKQDPLQKYPEPRSLALRAALAKRHAVKTDQVLVGNGSDEVLSILFRAMLAPGDTLLIPDPTYSLYPVLTDIIDAKIEAIPVQPDWQIDFDAILQRARQAVQAAERIPLIVFAHPNAPTGLAESKEDILNFVRAAPCPVLVDEAYSDFGPFSMAEHVGQADLPGLMVCGTFSKSYSLAGLRAGWLIAPAAVIAELDKIRDSYNLNRLTQAAAVAALNDSQEFKSRIQSICTTRDRFQNDLRQLGFECLTSATNFIFASPPPPHNNPEGARAYFEYLEQHDILIRYFSVANLARFVRISIGSADDMQAVLAATRQWLQQN